MDRELLTYRLSDLMTKITAQHIEELVFGLKYQSWSTSTQCVSQDQIPGKPCLHQTEITYAVKKPKNKSFNTVASNIVASNKMVSKMQGKENQTSIEKRRKITNEVGNHMEIRNKSDK